MVDREKIDKTLVNSIHLSVWVGRPVCRHPVLLLSTLGGMLEGALRVIVWHTRFCEKCAHEAPKLGEKSIFIGKSRFSENRRFSPRPWTPDNFFCSHAIETKLAPFDRSHFDLSEKNTHVKSYMVDREKIEFKGRKFMDLSDGGGRPN